MNRKALLTFLFGGLLPVVAFTVIEEYYGVVWGVVAGMVFSVGEILWEKYAQGKVSAITWITAGMILGMGGVSLWASDGVWFKLQPALLAAFFSAFLLGSLAMGKPFLQMAAEKGGRKLPPAMVARLPGLTLRLGVFFGAHALLGTWAALHWSTRNWALLKGVGVTVSLFLYMALEMLALRAKIRAEMRV